MSGGNTPAPTSTPAPTATPVPGETPAYVTSTSINMPGTGATIAACLTGGTGASARSDGFIDLQGGGKTATFTIPAPQAGIYYVQIKATAASAIRVEANDAYYQEMTTVPSTFVNTDASGKYAYIYLNEGDNNVTLINYGSNFTLYQLEIKRTNSIYEEGTFFDMSDLKAMSGGNTPVPTAGPAVTPGPNGLVVGNAIDYNNAPYAGVYKVRSDRAVTITNETGHTATLQPNVEQYFYLIKGDNDITKSDSAANLIFTVLQNNGMSYINHVNAGTAPIVNSNTYFGPANYADGATISSFVVATTGNATTSSDTVTLAPGASVTVQGNIAMDGLYYIQVQFTADGTNSLECETTTGHFTQINQHRSGWNYYYDVNTYDMDPVYMRSGTEAVTITNVGSTTCSFTGVRIARSSSYSDDPQMVLSNCKVIPVTVGDAPVLVDGFKGFALEGDTATVSYTKATDTNPEAITLYIAEYAGNKLVQVNLVVVDTTKQVVGTTEAYSVSLPSASAGTVKAMLLDANLAPLF